MLGVWLLIPISYQRTPSCSARLVPPVFTVWFTTRDSVPARLRYGNRYITRSASESNLFFVLGCGTQGPPPQASVTLAPGGVVGPPRPAGSTPRKLVLNWKLCCLPPVPASMAVRSQAQSLAPANVEPL